MSPSILIRGALTVAGPLDVRVDANQGTIVEVGTALQPEAEQDVIDAQGQLLWPGMVNTHHHLAQSIVKGLPAGINADLNDWLPAVPFAAWPHFDADSMYAAAMIGFYELLRSGCTTCADHHYLYQDGAGRDLEAALIQAAEDVGIRLVLCRGGATTSGSHLGLREAGIRHETLDGYLAGLQRLLDDFHDPHPNAMRRLVVAPTSIIHGSEPDALRELARFARSNRLLMHSHLLEVTRDEAVAQESHGMGAAAYAASVDWLGDDVWFAHLVHTDDSALALLAETRTGIAHCPTSNCRLGSGISPVPRMAKAGVRVSLGVDGSASAEAGSMSNELMLSWLLHRAGGGAEATTLEDCMGWATVGGADVLGLNVGRIEVGAAADLVLYDLSDWRYAGVWQRALAPVLCGEPVLVSAAMVNGRWVLREGRLCQPVAGGLDQRIQEAVQAFARRMTSA